MLTKEGRRILVQHVLKSMAVYIAIAIDLPHWAIKAIDRIKRGFLWRGRKEDKGGHYIVAWTHYYIVAWTACASPKSLVVLEFPTSRTLAGLFV